MKTAGVKCPVDVLMLHFAHKSFVPPHTLTPLHSLLTHTHTHTHTHYPPRADAPIIGYLLEYCCNLEHIIRYRPDGHCHGDMQMVPPKPQRLEWEIPPQVRQLDQKFYQ